MIKKLFAISILALAINANAQTPPWQWIEGAGGANQKEGRSVITDANGNIIVTGMFTGSTITFGTFTLTNTNSGTYEVFIVKYNPTGNVLWARSATGSSNDNVANISTDTKGNILITGNFQSPTMTFGGITITNHDNDGSSNALDVFIAKYDAAGNILWAKDAGGGGDTPDAGSGITADVNGNVLVVGGFNCPKIGFGVDTVVNTNSYQDIFIVKYDSLGNVLWAKGAGGTSSDGGTSIGTDNNGNVVIGGGFSSAKINFGTDTLTNASSSSGSNLNLFVAKYDALGNVLWAKNAGNVNIINSTCTNLSVDASGNIVTMGDFQGGHIVFGSTTLINADSMSMNPTNPIFITKYSSAGNVLWAQSPVGASGNADYGITTDNLRNVFVAGNFVTKTITLGTYTLTNTDTSSMFGGTQDIFVAKLDSSGNVLWATSVKGAYWDEVYGISTNALGSNIAITGSFYSTKLIFGTDTLTNADNTQASPDFYVAKFGNSTTSIISELNNINTIVLYPNPNNGNFVMEPNSNTKQTMQVYDVNGKLVLSQIINGKATIDASILNEGVYNISIIIDEGVINKRLVIVR